MATHQDCWSGKNKDEAQEWLSNLSIGEKLLHPPPQMEYNKTTPTGDKFEQVVIKEKTDNYVVISYPNRNEQWDKKLPLKYAFAVRPIGDNSNEDDDLSNLSQSSNNSNTSDASIVSPNNTIPFPPINNNDNNNNNNNNIKNNSNHVTMTFKKTKKKHKKKLHPFRDNNKILVAKSPSPSPTPTTNTNNNIPEITPPAADKTCFNKLHYTRSQTTTYKPLKHTYAETRSKNARNRNIFKKSLKKKGHKIQEEQRQNYQKTRTEIDNRMSKIEEEEKEKQAKKKQKLQEENSGQCNGGSSSGYSRHGYNNGYSRYGYNNNNNGSDDDENNRPMTRSRYNSSMQQHSYESYKNGIIPSWITSAPNALLSEPIGLVNMGNTCFMNSTLQSLIHTSELRQFFLNNNNNKWITQQLNIDNPIGYKGQIAMNFSKLIYKMCDESVNGSHGYYSNSVRPSMIHWNLSGVLRQFADYRQHDAQEFMTNFLDALHEDLNRIKKKKYIEIPDFDKYEENNQTKRQFLYKRWHQIYLNRNNSICTDLFAGLLKSAVTCPKCNFTAITFDPFMHLLVPLKCKSNLFKNNITNYYNHNRYNNNNNNNNNINEKCEITFILLPKNSLDEPEEYNIKINKNIIDTNDWIRFNAKIYDYLLGRLTDYKCEPKHDKYRCQMIKSGEFHSSYLYYGKKFISTMKDFLSGSFTIPKCIANDKIVELPMFEIFELFEKDKILYLSDICDENYNTKINEYILNKGHRRLIIHELPQHWSDKDRLSMEMDQKIDTFIVFKKPLNINENNDNKQREEDEYIPYEPFNFPRLIFEKGLTGKIDYIKLNKYLYKQSKNIVIGICGDKINEKINLNQEMEIRYSTSDDIFTLNKINTYQKVDLNCDNNNNNNNNNNNYKPQSIKTMVIIFSFKMQQLYIEYQRNKEQHNNSNGKKRSFEEANINNENINNNNHNNPRKKQKLNHNNNNNNDNKNKNKNKNNNINILPKKFQVKNSTASTIEECFGMYLSSEQLGKDNKWYCKKCKLHVQGRKQLTLWWLPKYLIIVIKRFENHGLRKCTSHVRYPVTGLDLTQLIGGKDSLDIYYDKNNNKNNNKYKDKQFIYDLYAVINHSGSLNFGHYTATIKYNKKWYDISDSCVSDCHNPVSSQAYILCYKQQSN